MIPKDQDLKLWLETELLENRSKQNVLRIAHLAQYDPKLIDAVFECIAEGKDKIDWRSAWVLDHLNQISKETVRPYLSQMIMFLSASNNESLQRTYLKILGQNEIPKENSGVLMDLCFELLNNPQSAVAVRAWCIFILMEFAKKYPEIKNELKPILELISQTGTAGEKSRAQVVLKTLDKES